MARAWLLAGLVLAGRAAAEPLPVDADPALVHAVGDAAYLEDTAGRTRLEEIRRRGSEFAPLADTAPNFGLSRSAFWLRYELESGAAVPQRLYLRIDYPWLADAALFVTQGGRLLRTEWTGAGIAARVRPVPDTSLVLPFELAARSRTVLYLRVTAEGVPAIVPARILDEAALLRARSAELWRNGALAGVFGALFLLHLVLWIQRRERGYAQFLLLLAAGYAGLTVANGFGPAYLYPGWSWPQRLGLPLTLGLATALLTQLSRALLDTARVPRMDRMLQLGLPAAALMVTAALALPLAWSLAASLAIFVLVPGVCAIAALRLLLRGERAARLHLAAQLVTLAAFVHQGLVLGGVLRWNAWSGDGLAAGVAGAALLVALALADRHALRRDVAHRAEIQVRRTLEQRAEELERTVAQRTAELEQSRNHAEYLATTDAVTGILNRRGFLPLLEREVELAQRAHLPLALIAFDIDYFKRINDEFGEAEGDRILRQVVDSARDTVRSPDLFGRLAGEEFALVLRDTAGALARDVGERIRAAINARVRVGPDGHAVSASFGVAALGSGIDGADALVRAALAGVDRAKHRGRNRVVLFEPEEAGALVAPLLPPGARDHG